MPQLQDSHEILQGARRLGLGTVQFGLDYGVTNRSGRVMQDNVARILAAASSAGIDVLDTAALYGDSERVLGQTSQAQSFRVVSKTPIFSNISDASSLADRFRFSLDGTLARLKRPILDAILVHHAADLLGPLSEVLWHEMERSKTQGLVKAIGVSVYEGNEIDALLARFPLDIVQLPLNAVDHRLIDGGQIERLAERGIEVHARSVLLQGLLSLAPEQIEPRFELLGSTLSKMRAKSAELGVSLLGLLLGAVLRHTAVSRLIVGVTSDRELVELIAAADEAATSHARVDYTKFRICDTRLLNPAQWPTLG